MAAERHYVIALGKAYLPDTFDIEKGRIISTHTEFSKALDRCDKANSKNSVTSTRKPLFGVLTTDKALAKGSLHPDLANQWLARRYDENALYIMKCVLDPIWHGKAATTEQDIGWMLEDLGQTLEGLRSLYQDKAEAELDRLGAGRIAVAERTARIKAVSATLQAERSQFSYTFPAVAGTQAGRAFYAAQVPYGALVRLFRFDEEDVVPAELRAQRVMSERRAEAIGQYVVDNPADYVLPALTASVSADMAFEPVDIPGAAGSLGLLHIPMESTLLINDGQHRRRGIELAIKDRPALANETVTVTLFFDQGLKRSQQMFADINGRQVKPSSAINALYDRRNPFNAWALSVIDMLPGVGQRIDMENSSVAAKSYKLWSLIAFKKFLSLLTGVTEKNIGEVDGAALAALDGFLLQFFEACTQHVPYWREMVSGEISAFEMRERFVISHAVWLEALAVFGRCALFSGDHGRAEQGIIKPELAAWERMEPLAKVDARKVSLMWAKRCVVLGKMQKTSDGVNGTAAKLLQLTNVPLPAHMQELEKRLAA